MKIQKRHKFRLRKTSLLLIILFISLFPAFLANSNFTRNFENLNKDGNTNTGTFNIENLKSSALGNDTWWDTDFAYRRLITITNPYDSSFTDFGVRMILNYAELGSLIQSDLDDIRIVENDELRKYHVSKDYPKIGFASIWFDTNITQSTTERDTYLYFGNSLAANAEANTVSDSFGWIKNGDFELDNSTDRYFDPYGWTFSHDQVDQIKDISNSREASNYSLDSYNNFENTLVHIDNRDMAERVDSGYYAYKWGGEGSFLPQAACKDYVGTFYSYPFKVPIIEGGEISLNVYRNVRTWFFEDPDSALPTISEDGYFLRLCNGSDSQYTNEVDLHDNIGSGYDSWIETFGGFAYISPNKKTLRYHDELKEHFELDPEIFTRSDTSGDGDLTGSLEIDVTNYMGKEIFIEFGTWGPEDGDIQTVKSGFFQVDDIKFNYTLSAEIEDIQAQESSIEVIVKDIDGRSVPTADVMIVDNSYPKGSANYYVANGTSINGRTTFSNIPIGYYNITANYTLGSQSTEVFNSIEKRTGPYYFNGIDYTIDIYLNLWTIDFEIVDWDGIPLKYGYIEINESQGGPLLEKLTLDDTGKATFRWLNSSSYYYGVYYNNDDYGIDFSPTLLNESSILRNDYIVNNVKFRHHTVNVNQTSTGSFSVSERFYTDGSRTSLGNKKIIKANISLNNLQNYMTDISVYYIDNEDSIIGNLIYHEDYSDSVTDDFIELDIPQIDNSNLENDKYEVYGLLIEVNGYNTTQSNGVINVDLVETCNVETRTPIARLNIRLTYFSDIDKEYKPLSGTIKVIDVATGLHLINLSAMSVRDGYAYAPKNSYETPFWYLTNKVYNFSIDVPNNPNVDFNITYINPSQWIPAPGVKIKWYNYTLYRNSSISFNVIPAALTNFTQYDTEFNLSYGTTEVLWGENMVFWAELLSTDDDWQTSDFVPKPPGSCILTITLAGSGEILRTVEMNYNSNGNYTLIYNSGLISAGGDWEYYNIEINGYHPIYDDPTPLVYLVKVIAKPTSMSAHDYDSLNLIPSKIYSTYFDELINITVRYTETEFGTPLTDALLSYEWIGLNPISIFSDPLKNDYFTFTINTADAQSTGLKIISITASFENYTTKSDFLVYLNILERKTTLNEQSEDLYYISAKIYIQDQRNFIFTYRDANTSNIIGDLTVSNYVWEELYANGSKILGSIGSGSLSQNLNHSYTLDFNTEFKPVGYYFLYVTFKQDNYEQKNAFIYIEIMLREFTATVQEPQLGTNNQITIAQGADLHFKIYLWDDTRGEELQNAIVKFNFRGINYSLDPIPIELGTYNTTLLTKDIDTFFMAQTFVGKIYITAANFTKQEFTITITIKMEEIWPGMPMFYFILITASIAGVAGSIIAYRVIQQARIPKHVKKIRKVKSLIKSKKTIPKTFTVLPKDKMIAKLFGEEWKEIGLSIEESLGINDLKKKATIKDKLSKEGGESE